MPRGKTAPRTRPKASPVCPKIRVAVCGAAGFTGFELLRILLAHPKAEVTLATSEQDAGKSVSESHPVLRGRTDLRLEHLDLLQQTSRADVFFLALPNGQAMQMAPQLLAAGKKVIDLGADFRIRDLALFRKFYGNHSSPELVRKAVYGLCELHRPRIVQASLVANPGCYATSAILALAPLLEAGVIEGDGITVFAASGVSGAGRRTGDDKSFVAVNEGFHAYNPVTHRHRPEIEQELEAALGKSVHLSFIPHLLPLTRGILATISARSASKSGAAAATEVLEKAYRHSPFIRLRVLETTSPNVLDVQGTNFCDLGVIEDRSSGRLLIFSALDNLIKGASGQAVQNMNLMCGLDETTGLL
ncbi:MAG: N-acetyl-gamma-glutamyl-phosphate reductase [Nitrospirae bacterium]|nr:N-acetyl-gamma-glutamyl-phosphate reductase [Nitrospirota bacterium]